MILNVMVEVLNDDGSPSHSVYIDDVCDIVIDGNEWEFFAVEDDMDLDI